MEKEQKEWKWPLGIFVGYMIFVTGTLGMVFFTFTQSRDLVAEDYYAKTMVFDEHMERVRLAKNLENPLSWQLADQAVKFSFPEELLPGKIEGNITLFRPSDASLDRHFEISVDEAGTQNIPIAGLQKGMWKVQVSWSSGEQEYYVESDLYLR